jgi:alginate export protein
LKETFQKKGYLVVKLAKRNKNVGMGCNTIWCCVLSTLLGIGGAGSVKAVEYGEMVQKEGKWVFRSTEDPVLKLMRDKEVITNERYNEVSAQRGKNWIEPADAILNRRQDIEWTRYLKTALHLPDWVDLGLENRTRFESYDHPWRSTQKSGNGGTDAQLLLRSRARVGLGGNGPFRFLFEGTDSRALSADEPGDFRNTTTIDQFDITQLFGALSINNVGGSGLRTDLHFGRMTMDFGNRRYVARNDFRNTTNAFDGVHWQISEGQTWRFRAFLVEPVIRHEVSLDEQTAKSVFWGAYAESAHFPWFNMNLFYFGLNDQQPTNKALHRTYSTYGLRLFKSPAVSEFDYEFEGAIQTGHLGNVEHFAYNPNVEAGYTFNLPWTPRFLVQYTYASGTRTPGGSQDGTFDILFGARRFDLDPTGIWGPFFRSNISSPGWRLILRPDDTLTLNIKQRFWYLAEARAAYTGGLVQDATGSSGNYLGHDLELRAQWTPLWAMRQNMDFDFGYVHWFKGSYFDNSVILAQMPAGGNKDSDYFYASVRVRL